jgi:dTDP-4-amino-4,6-dideoxygalactose transaminase
MSLHVQTAHNHQRSLVQREANNDENLELSTADKGSELPRVARFPWCVKKSFSLERYGEYIMDSVASGHTTNGGPLQQVVKAKVKDVCATQRSLVMTSSGTAALHALGCAFELHAERRLAWATQAFTWPSSIQGPFSTAYIVDLDPHLMGPSLDALETIKDQIDGIVVTSVFGLQSKLLEYEAWCKSRGKILLLDHAATPIGFVEDGRCIHDIGDGAFISLHETKPLGRGEGGAVFVESRMQPFVERALNFGFDSNLHAPHRVHHRAASNWRMSDFAAAAICDHLDNVKDQNWVELYKEHLSHAISQVERAGFAFHPKPVLPTIPSCLFLRLPEHCSHEALEQVVRFLNCHSRSIEAKRYYLPLCDPEDAPNAWRLFSTSICLPFHLDLSKEMITYQISLLSKAIDALCPVPSKPLLEPLREECECSKQKCP